MILIHLISISICINLDFVSPQVVPRQPKHGIIFYPYELSWVDAGEYCRRDGGLLASIHSLEENELAGYSCDTTELNSCWIGLSSSTVWSDGRELNWHNMSSATQNGTGCGAINPTKQFLWERIGCDQFLPFLCQYHVIYTDRCLYSMQFVALNWSDAREFCQGTWPNGELATLREPEANIAKTQHQLMHYAHNFWIGYKSEQPQEDLKWSDGYRGDWLEGVEGPSNYQCVVMELGDNFKREQCEDQFAFLCQIPHQHVTYIFHQNLASFHEAEGTCILEGGHLTSFSNTEMHDKMVGWVHPQSDFYIGLDTRRRPVASWRWTDMAMEIHDDLFSSRWYTDIDTLESDAEVDLPNRCAYVSAVDQKLHSGGCDEPRRFLCSIPFAYRVFENALSFSAAADTCASKGGYIVSIGSQEQNEIVVELCSTMASACFIGLYKTSADGPPWDCQSTGSCYSWGQGYAAGSGGENPQWRWASGASYLYSNFASPPIGNTSCTVINSTGGYWQEANCITPHAFVCQIPYQYIVDDKLRYTVAESQCNDYGGHLPSISLEVDTFSIDAVYQGQGEAGIWIGLDKRNDSVTFEYKDGTSFNVATSVHKIQNVDSTDHCLKIQDTWKSDMCNNTKGTVCQLPSCDGNTTVCYRKRLYKLLNELDVDVSTQIDSEELCQNESLTLTTVKRLEESDVVHAIGVIYLDSNNVWLGFKELNAEIQTGVCQDHVNCSYYEFCSITDTCRRCSFCSEMSYNMSLTCPELCISGNAEFEWKDGSPAYFTRWGSAQPKINLDGVCVSAVEGSWVAVSCQNELNFICTEPDELVPVTSAPANLPSYPALTHHPTLPPTPIPTPFQTLAPEPTPTLYPTILPTAVPTPIKTANPTSIPTLAPTFPPTPISTSLPTPIQSSIPSISPTGAPTRGPVPIPSTLPTTLPTSPPDELSEASPLSEGDMISNCSHDCQTGAVVFDVRSATPQGNEGSQGNGQGGEDCKSVLDNIDQPPQGYDPHAQTSSCSILDCAGGEMDVRATVLEGTVVLECFQMDEDFMLASDIYDIVLDTNASSESRTFEFTIPYESKECVNELDHKLSVDCKWYDVDRDEWLGDDCHVIESNILTPDGSLGATCQCSHLTAFAIIQNVDKFRAQCNYSSVLGNDLWLAFIAIYIFLFLLCARQLYEMIHIKRCNREIRVYVHGLVAGICILHITIAIVMHTSDQLDTMDLPIELLVVLWALVYVLSFWIYALVVISWAKILHKNTLDPSRFKITKVFMTAGTVISLLIMTEFIAAFAANNKSLHMHVLIGSILIGGICGILAFGFLIYGSMLIHTLKATSQGIAVNIDNFKPVVTRIFRVAAWMSLFLIIQGTLHIFSAVEPDKFFDHFTVLQTVYLSCDVCMLAVVLYLFFSVIKREQQNFTKSIEDVDMNYIRRKVTTD